MKDSNRNSLLDMLAGLFDLVYLSDLRYLSFRKYHMMAKFIELYIPAEAVPLFEWNDALYYLSDRRPEKESEAARSSLIEALGGISRK